MIRLGSMAGYSFEGPRVLAGWNPPAAPGVFAIMCELDTGKGNFAVIYVDEAEDLSQAGFPFSHPKSPAWIKRAGNKFNLRIAWYEIPAVCGAGHRKQLVVELISAYSPSCNDERYSAVWEDKWIGNLTEGASVVGPGQLTTDRDPNSAASNATRSSAGE